MGITEVMSTILRKNGVKVVEMRSDKIVDSHRDNFYSRSLCGYVESLRVFLKDIIDVFKKGCG